MASAGRGGALGELADVRVTTGPPMIKDENGVLVGYVFADIDQTQRDLGAGSTTRKPSSRRSSHCLQAPAADGSDEFLAEMEARLRYVIPLTLVLVVVLLYLSMRGWPQTFLVLSSLPFAVAGSVWLLAFMDYNLSTAVWVGSSPSRASPPKRASSWSHSSTRRSNVHARRPHSHTSGRGRGGG